MIIKNKYSRIYNDLMNKRRHEIILKEEQYCESHHIMPKSLGGSDDKSNKVNLLPREHWISHLLLTKMTVGDDNMKMCWALHRMAFSGIDYFGSRDYDWYRRRHVDWLKENHPLKHPTKGAARRQSISERVYKDWEDNTERKKNTSLYFKRWREENPEEFLENQRKGAKLGGEAARLSIAKRLEYKGKMYIGWNELLEQTGVSKHLYNKYYKQGIDPEPRIGRDGPLTQTEKENLRWPK